MSVGQDKVGGRSADGTRPGSSLLPNGDPDGRKPSWLIRVVLFLSAAIGIPAAIIQFITLPSVIPKSAPTKPAYSIRETQIEAELQTLWAEVGNTCRYNSLPGWKRSAGKWVSTSAEYMPTPPSKGQKPGHFLWACVAPEGGVRWTVEIRHDESMTSYQREFLFSRSGDLSAYIETIRTFKSSIVEESNKVWYFRDEFLCRQGAHFGPCPFGAVPLTLYPVLGPIKTIVPARPLLEGSSLTVTPYHQLPGQSK